jgi:hypothetical protein
MPLDAAEFRLLYYELKFAGDNLHVDLREGLRWAGQGALDAVRDAASFSHKIPAATRVRVSFGSRNAGVRVVTSAAQAPNARPINHHNELGRFKHPVFGHRDRLVSQTAIPFYLAAGRAPAIDKQVQEVLDHVTFHAGFH